MVNPYGWSGTAHEMSGAAATLAVREGSTDVASVARMWVVAAYDDLRRAGPDRAVEVRRILCSYVIPWFGPQTNTVGDISYFMVHEWLLKLVGRQRSEPEDDDQAPALFGLARTDGELSLREAAQKAEVSLATARRRWRDGELPGAYRDRPGQVRVPEPTVAALRRRKRQRPVGLSQTVVADALWVLRRVLGFARATVSCRPVSTPLKDWRRRLLTPRWPGRDDRRRNRGR